MMNMKLTKEQIECNKREVIELLRSTKRDGIDGLLKVMEEGGYYTAKCHSHHHYVGGLMLHSLSTCRIALSKDSGLSRDSIIVCTLLHDLCDIKGYSEFGGHGERSMNIAIASGLNLSSGEKCAIRCHMRKEHRIPHGWDDVLAVPENKALYRLVYDADKSGAKHDNPIPKMKHVRGGKILVSYEAYDRIEEEEDVLNDFEITPELISWRLWRFVMGRDVKPLVEFEDHVDMRDRMPLAGEIMPDMRDEFLQRLNEMTGRNYSFPTYFQWEMARRKGIMNDLGKKLEILYTHSSAVGASGNEKNHLPSELSYGGIDFSWIGYRLVIAK